MSRLCSFLNRRVVVTVGTGGVGKTTTSAAMGLAAAESGKKVLVMTVDPAKRLATSLGMNLDFIDPIRVEGVGCEGGFLEALVIHPKEIFESFVRESSKDPEIISRLMKNRLYQQLTTRLAGSQEFTSLEMLLRMFKSEKYDLIILDTPPAQHALDFLKAPLKLHELFQSSITKWFVKNKEGTGFLGKIFATGTEKVLDALKQLTGSQFIEELQGFLRLAQAWQEKLSQRMVDVHNLLTGPSTSFVLVTSYNQAKLEEAEEFHRNLKREGYVLGGLVVNRMSPEWMIGKSKTSADTLSVVGSVEDSIDSIPSKSSFAELFGQVQAMYKIRAENLALFEGRLSGQLVTIQVPDFSSDIYSLSGLQRVSPFFISDQ